MFFVCRLHKVPEAFLPPPPPPPPPPCLWDFRDHGSDMPYNAVRSHEGIRTTMTYSTSEKDVTRPCAVREEEEEKKKSGDICVPPRFKCVLLGLSFLDPTLPVGVVSV